MSDVPVEEQNPAVEEPPAPQPEPVSEPPVEENSASAAFQNQIQNLVEEWWNDHMPGSVLGRNTEMWNYVHAAKEALKTKLLQLAP